MTSVFAQIPCTIDTTFLFSLYRCTATLRCVEEPGSTLVYNLSRDCVAREASSTTVLERFTKAITHQNQQRPSNFTTELNNEHHSLYHGWTITNSTVDWTSFVLYYSVKFYHFNLYHQIGCTTRSNRTDDYPAPSFLSPVTGLIFTSHSSR